MSYWCGTSASPSAGDCLQLLVWLMTVWLLFASLLFEHLYVLPRLAPCLRDLITLLRPAS